jgi:prepilin-type N-terminal cleavage/methylation domain-containing protein
MFNVSGKSKTGFTLAEVLITLSIIGVVAALTIPTLTRNYEKQQWITNFKVAYNILLSATNMVLADNNGLLPHSAYVENYEKYLKIIKRCPDDTAGCFGATYKRMNGSPENYEYFNQKILLSNGIAVAFRNGFGFVAIDTNGVKGPNVNGKDVFIMSYAGNRLDFFKPEAGLTEEELKTYCPDNLSGGGSGNDSAYYCGIRILRGDYGTAY